jgi:hypothetical protein
MSCYHWHGHIELNIPFEDDVRYLLNGREFVARKNHLTMFWAAMPHRLIEHQDCGYMMIANIPIQMFLCLPLEEEFDGWFQRQQPLLRCLSKGGRHHAPGLS